MNDSTPSMPWYESAAFRRVVLWTFPIFFLIKAAQGIFFKKNDFEWHLLIGQYALNGTPYFRPDGEPIGYHYLPGRVLLDAALAMLPATLARALVFIAAILALAAIAQIWRRLADAMQPASPGLNFGAAVLAVLLLAQWIGRDLDDCGLQIILLFMLSMAGWSVWRGARIAAGGWLAVAISYKSMPIIFLVLLLWKRRWLEAGATVVFVLLINIALPIALWGPDIAGKALTENAQRVWLIATLEDPSENGVEPPNHRNQNLQLTIARFLQTYQPGHRLFIHRRYDDNVCPPDVVAAAAPDYCLAHPLFIQFLDLPPRTAKTIVLAVILLIALAIAWRMRRPWSLAAEPGTGWDRSALAPEWAVACAFTALLSPLTWQHHLTLALPCAYLVIRDLLMNPGPRSRWLAIGLVFACTWLIQRMILQKQLSIIAMSYHDDVLAVLILIVLTLTLMAERQAAQSTVPAAVR